jgi:hypothetical protein
MSGVVRGWLIVQSASFVSGGSARQRATHAAEEPMREHIGSRPPRSLRRIIMERLATPAPKAVPS